MPLQTPRKGSSKQTISKAVSQNIHQLKQDNKLKSFPEKRPRQQIIAIALAEANKSQPKKKSR